MAESQEEKTSLTIIRKYDEEISDILDFNIANVSLKLLELPKRRQALFRKMFEHIEAKARHKQHMDELLEQAMLKMQNDSDYKLNPKKFMEAVKKTDHIRAISQKIEGHDRIIEFLDKSLKALTSVGYEVNGYITMKKLDG